MGFVESHENSSLPNRSTARYGQESAPQTRAQGHQTRTR